ncbi:Proline iminopeptidase [Nymphon striatum]|nr:Proline iminopeptidase [Nymphon striatum]
MPLYPKIENPTTYSIKVDTTHQLYVEECGNPDGIPVIFLHGGPGSGCNPDHRRYFNPKLYRIILFDQRGCGRSTPHGCLEKNTTHHLIDDIERIRQELKIDQWLIFAGSWGVTLALLYAQANSDKVTGLVLRGAFLASKRDLNWFFNDDGVARLYPELWEIFSTSLPKLKPDESLLQSLPSNAKLNKKAAKAWSDWTDTIVTWTLPTQSNPAIDNDPKKEITDKQLRSIRLEVHYAVNNYFLQEEHIINNMHLIKHIPTHIIHGRKDITCPVESSWRLHKEFTSARLKILPDAGHLANEPDMIEALVKATNTIIKEVY